MARSFANLPGFDVTKRIGKGAGAIIYEARERSSRRRVAVKHVVRGGPQDDRFIEQAEAEYKVAHALDHRYLRKCYNIFRVRRWLKIRELFIVMELVEGERLDNIYKDRRPETLEPVIRIFRMIAEGLSAMHAHAFVHADIKPNNILLSSDGAVKIIDFGQSCAMGHRKERIQGTPDFIAPEQVLLTPLDQRTDVYNFGATMYGILTGKAFSTVLPNAPAGAKKIEIDARRGNEPPHELNEHVPLPLSRLIMECCANERENRPWDMNKVISRLDMSLMTLERKQTAATAPNGEKEALGEEV